jgi:hypothetical protein
MTELTEFLVSVEGWSRKSVIGGYTHCRLTDSAFNIGGQAFAMRIPQNKHEKDAFKLPEHEWRSFHEIMMAKETAYEGESDAPAVNLWHGARSFHFRGATDDPDYLCGA